MIFGLICILMIFWTIGYGLYLAFAEDKDRDFNV